MPDPIALMTHEIDQTASALADVVEAMSAEERGNIDWLFEQDPGDCLRLALISQHRTEFLVSLAALAWSQACLSAFTKGRDDV